MAVGAKNSRIISVLPELKVAASGLPSDEMRRFIKQLQEISHLVRKKSHAYNADKHRIRG